MAPCVKERISWRHSHSERQVTDADGNIRIGNAVQWSSRAGRNRIAEGNMKAHYGSKKSGEYWLCFLAASLLIGCVAMLEVFQLVGAASGESLSAIYSHGILRLNVP